MRRLAVLLAVIALLAIGCGADEPAIEGVPTDATPTADTSETAAVTSPGTIAEINDKGTETFTSEDFEAELELDNFYFEPTFIKSPGDGTARLTLHNEGDVPHTFTSDTLDFDEELQPGDEKELTVEIGTETRYEFYCRFHADRGMRGAFQPH